MSPGPKMTLMIVDDHPRMRATMRKLCAGPGDTVIEIGDGAEAQSAYDEHHPDWVLMDIEMPGMDGLAATRAILQRHPGARIVVVTQHDDDELFEQGRASGAVACLLKEDLSDLPAIIAGSAART